MRRFLLALIALLAALACAEIALRAFLSTKRYHTWPPGMRKVFKPDPALLPGISGDSRFEVNGDGIRGDELPRGDAYCILAVGGSTTECLYLDQEEAWPRLLERKLTALGTPTWIGNVGKSGLRTREHVVQVDLLLDQHPRIDAVLMLVGQNDFMYVLKAQEHFDPSFMSRPDARQLLVRRTFYRVDDFAKEGGLALWYFLREKLGSSGLPETDPDEVLDDVGRAVQRWREQRRNAAAILDRLPDLTPGLTDYQRNLEYILDAVEKRKKRIVLVTQPSLWRADLTAEEQALLQSGYKGLRGQNPKREYYSVAALERGIAEFNRLLQAIAQRRGVECIDLAARLPRDSSLFYDDVHFNEKGSARVADLLFEVLSEEPPYGGK